MSATLMIHNVPEWVRNELAARAARSGRSLQEYLAAHLTELASRPAVEDVLARVRLRANAAGHELDVAVVLADREAERP